MENENTRLKLFREKINLSQKEFGKIVGLEQGSISDLERGKANIADYIKKTLKTEKGLNIEWLETGTGEMFKKEKLESINPKPPMSSDRMMEVLYDLVQCQREVSRLKEENDRLKAQVSKIQAK
jgi:transcriptional regulator with XRE-family HTH domain